jgi:hypothetical protein
MADGPEPIAVEVVYALPAAQTLLRLAVARGTTVVQAIHASGVLERHPEIDLAQSKVGLFGKVTTPETVLQAGDRVEIYRPLLADPKEVRRLRAAQGKGMRKGQAGEDDSRT